MSPRPTKAIGKDKSLAEDFKQRIDVFGSGVAAGQQDACRRGAAPNDSSRRLALALTEPLFDFFGGMDGLIAASLRLTVGQNARSLFSTHAATLP